MGRQFMVERTAAVERFWSDYRAAAGLDHDHYMVVDMGDGPEMSAELIALMLAGTKRATASLVRDFETTGEALPRPGDHFVVVDHGGSPVCICQTTEIAVRPLDEVDEAFAWDEGEGDRTRASWLRDHRWYFARQAAREGFAMDDRIPTVFERFRIVWPAAVADRT